jgi:UDP:flavonoid glycosyltransferase YjiC (YdhE family)
VRIGFYISGHGFGHAARDIEVIHALTARRSDLQVIVRTSVTPALFTAIAGERVELQPLETDSGLTQIDSLHIDEEDSARQAARFYATFDRRVDDEAAALRAAAIDLVVGDVPPLAFAAAARARIPSLAVANFTWDWIYSVYPAFDRIAPEVQPTIRAAYAQTTRALRLPLHGGFEPMAAVTVDIPLIARRSTRDRAETRRAAGVADGDTRPVVLPSFGAYGAALPLDALRRSGRLTVLDPSHVPDGFRYQDLVAAADVVVSKPGYGIVSECVANDTPLLYTSRGRFIEYDVFVEGMPRILRCRYISQEDLLAGRWADDVDALLAQPAPPERARLDGAAIAVEHALAMLTPGADGR